jgi:hypothetical protein
MGVGSTHYSSSRSVESDDIVREKSTAVGLLLCGGVLALAVLGVTGPTGSSSSSLGSDIDSSLSSASDQDGGSSTI